MARTLHRARGASEVNAISPSGNVLVVSPDAWPAPALDVNTHSFSWLQPIDRARARGRPAQDDEAADDAAEHPEHRRTQGDPRCFTGTRLLQAEGFQLTGSRFEPGQAGVHE